MTHKAEPIATVIECVSLAFGAVIRCPDGSEVITPMRVVCGASRPTPQERQHIRALYHHVSRAQPW